LVLADASLYPLFYLEISALSKMIVRDFSLSQSGAAA